MTHPFDPEFPMHFRRTNTGASCLGLPVSAHRTTSARRTGSVRTCIGFSLLELLVVLVILAIVATLAVNSLQPRVESARFEQTRNLLENIRQATIGQQGSRQTDGTPLVSGFLADIGRLPRANTDNPVSGPQDGMELSELWSTNGNLAKQFPFRFRSGPKTPVDYSQIQLPCGWRGPYLQLPMGTKTLTDAWGRPLQFEYSENATIDCVTWLPTGNVETELNCELKNGKVIVTGTLDFGQSEPSSVQVVLLAPNPDSSLSELTVFADEDTNAGTFAFTDVPVGLRAIHVRVDDQQLTRYVQVPHHGLSLSLDLALAQPNTPEDETPQE